MSDQFFIDRKQQNDLQHLLRTIPTLLEDLAITITRQARIQKHALGKLHRTKPESRLPFHLAAAQANDDLHTTLVTWVRAVAQERHLRYHRPETTIALAEWLQHRTHELALMSQAEQAYNDLTARILDCRQHIDLPPDDDILIDAERLREANRKVMTAEQVERIATQLGPLGNKLDARRIRTLVRQRKLRPIATDDGVMFYRLGDVLHAHHQKDDPKKQAWERLRDAVNT